MPSGLDAMSDTTPLRRLLTRYRELGEASQDAEWHDRVMELEGAGPAELSKLHGILLAKGWLDTRVSREALATPGRLKACYRATKEGLAVLRGGGLSGDGPEDESAAEGDAEGVAEDAAALPLADDTPPPGEERPADGTGPW